MWAPQGQEPCFFSAKSPTSGTEQHIQALQYFFSNLFFLLSASYMVNTSYTKPTDLLNKPCIAQALSYYLREVKYDASRAREGRAQPQPWASDTRASLTTRPTSPARPTGVRHCLPSPITRHVGSALPLWPQWAFQQPTVLARKGNHGPERESHWYRGLKLANSWQN